MTRPLALLAALLWAALPTPAQAHQTGKSVIRCDAALDAPQVRCALSLSGDDLAHYLQFDPPTRAALQDPTHQAAALDHISKQLVVRNGKAICTAASAPTLAFDPAQPATIHVTLERRCPLPWRTLEVTDAIMVNTPGGYRHLGTLSVGEHQLVTVFDAAHIDATLVIDGAAPGQETSIARYIQEGVLHILAGADHVLFVLVLALGATSLRLLAGMVTAFTLAHSVTLGVSATGLLSPPAALIEPLIALSILIAAAQVARRTARDPDPAPRWLAALASPFAFGLLHGFGFSYVLRDEVGLPADRLLPALAAFNIGVELGQLAILTACFPALAWARRARPDAHKRLVWIACAALGAVSLYWLVTRTLGA
jgi:hypothetical protein